MSFKKKEVSDDDSALADDRDDGVAAPAASDRGGSGPTISKRQFLKGATVGAGSLAAGGVSLNYSTRNARALAPAIPIAGFAVGAAIAYLVDSGVDPYVGDSRDYSGYQGATALETAMVEGATNMQSANERVMTSIQNNIQNSQNVALSKGKAAVIEAMNTGKSESEATTALQNAIDEYYSTIQQNIITHWKAQHSQILHFHEQAEAHADLSGGDSLFSVSGGNDKGPDFLGITTDAEVEYKENEVQLLDGSSVAYPRAGDGTFSRFFAVSSDHIAGSDPAILSLSTSQGNPVVLDPAPFDDAWQSLVSERDSVNQTLSGFVSDVYAAYEPGEIPTEDLVDPVTASTELAQDYDGYQAQGAYAAMLGIPTTAEHSVNLTVHTADGDRNIWADIYTEYVPTDDSGTEVGFQSGETYDPSTWDKPLYIAYEYTEETEDGTTTSTDFVQLEDSFTIDVIEDKDGNEVDSFQTKSRNNQTSDVSKLQEEIDQLREAQLEMQEEAQSGGGGFVDGLGFGGIPGEGVLVAIVGIVLVLLGQDD